MLTRKRIQSFKGYTPILFGAAFLLVILNLYTLFSISDPEYPDVKDLLAESSSKVGSGIKNGQDDLSYLIMQLQVVLDSLKRMKEKTNSQVQKELESLSAELKKQRSELDILSHKIPVNSNLESFGKITKKEKTQEFSSQCTNEEFSPKYSINTKRGVKIIDHTARAAFDNKADFSVISTFFKKNACRDSTMRNPVIFVCGANMGQLSWEISADCPNARIRGFEANPAIYENHLANKMTEKVTFHHIGVSNKTGKLDFYGDGNNAPEIGGFHSKGVYGLSFLASVEVQPLSAIIKTFSETIIDYVVIDVEGHEIEVVEGMDLAHQCKTFPIFQYELGGTWVDSARSSMRYTQGEFCQYLNDLGFEVFLMGHLQTSELQVMRIDETVRKKPLLMPMNKEIFEKSCPHREGKCFVQGNALAMRREYVDEETRNIVDSLVQTFLDIESKDGY